WCRRRMEQASVPKKGAKQSTLRAEVDGLNLLVREDLFLPSLREGTPRVQDHAFRFFLALPMYSSEGRRVFTEDHLGILHSLFDARFGGCLVSSSRSGVLYFGEYLPQGSTPIRDYHTVV